MTHLKKNKNILCFENNFLNSLRPVYFCSRAFGRLPFSIVVHPNGEVKRARVKFFDVLWFIISLFVYAFLILYYVNYLALSRQKISKTILFLCIDVNITLHLLMVSIMIIMDMHNRRRLIDIVRMFTSFDK